jgi:ubiquinone/menaquinone biosynthesis C-methylase UbiE
MGHVAAVRRYYERNTGLFRLLRADRQLHTVHRPVWAAEVRNKQQALQYVHARIAKQIRGYLAVRHQQQVCVLDLGCGTGATLCQLAQQFCGQLRGIGMSISRTQLQLAQQYACAQGVTEYCTFIEGDFCHLPCMAQFDLAIAIESLVHAPADVDILAQVASTLKPGGYLIICDDMLCADRILPDDTPLLEAFRRGWYAPSVRSVADVIARAQQAGLKLLEQCDLTQSLHLLPVPRVLGLVLIQLTKGVPPEWAFTQSLIGGFALQLGLRSAVFRYQWLVFEKHGLATET